MKERIQKIIAGAGITSRRKAEEMILEGRVRVNSSVVEALGTKADPQTDRIEVDGRLLSFKGPKVYILLNKPKGYICALSDQRQRPVVVELLRRCRNRLIKRMCMAVGHPVSKLKRIEFAGMGLGNLKIGEWRYLTEKEVERVLE